MGLSRSFGVSKVVGVALSAAVTGVFAGCLTDPVESESTEDILAVGAEDESEDSSPSPPPPSGTCVTIQRGGPGNITDAFLSGDYDGYETGPETQMWTGLSSAGNLNRVVMGFDLSPLPAASAGSVTSATLRVYKTWSLGNAQIEVHRATAPWSELTVTRESFGAAIDPVAVGTFSGGGGEGFRTVDITALVQDWQSGAVPNHGLVLEEPPIEGHHYWSSDVGNLAKRPSLEVCYVAATCDDGVQNQGEQSVDCGGPCAACPTCSDGAQNQGEQGVDCGGPCSPCATCSDGAQNQGETGVDCGGPCAACITTSCLTIKQQNPGATSGAYVIDTDGAGPKPQVTVYCDMSTDGGGYTMARFNDAALGGNQDVYTNKCAQYGMQVIVPRTKPHMLSIYAWNGNDYPNLINVFPNFNGASGLANWHGTCKTGNCSFYLSQNNNAWCNGSEPNGDNNVNYRLYRWAASSTCSIDAGSGGWNDANNTVAIGGWVICSTNDK